MIDDIKYCLDSRVEVVWIDRTFGLAKVFFREEGVEKVISISLITDEPYRQKTLGLNVLIRGMK